MRPKADNTITQTTNHSRATKRRLKKAAKAVQWKDLCNLSKPQVAYNLMLPYPFLLLSWWFAWHSWYVVACIFTYLFFAAAFRQAHDGYHLSLGVSRRTTDLLLILLSVLLLTGLHSIKATHRQHHRDPMGEDDMEGSLAKLTWWQALLGGVRYRFAIYKRGMQLSSAKNRRMAWIEFGLIGLTLFIVGIGALLSYLAVDLMSNSDYSTYTVIVRVAVYHLIVMMLANACVGVIAVWGVHHDAEDTIARTERNRVVNLVTFGLLFHVEHHLFPSVPTNNLTTLAKRLDAVAPQLTQKRVVPYDQNTLGSSNRRVGKEKPITNQSTHKTCPIRGLFA